MSEYIYVEKTENGLSKTPVKTDFSERCDVVIVGCGTASYVTAIELAQHGVSLLVIERTNRLGGVFTNYIYGYYYGAKGGLYGKIDAECRKLCKSNQKENTRPDVRCAYAESEILKSGKIEYSAVLCGVYLDKASNSLAGVKYLSEGVTKTVGCKYAVDGTAEAYLCELCGAKLHSGRQDGVCQPYTNASITAGETRLEILNRDSGYINQNEVFSMSEEFVRSYVQSCNDTQYNRAGDMICMPGVVPVREGRKIYSERDITLTDVLSGAQDPDALFSAQTNIDDHCKDIAFESRVKNDWQTAMSMWGTLVRVDVGLESLVPKGFTNVIVSGRHLGTDHELSAHVRMIRDMQKLGEAVGAVLLDVLPDNRSILLADRKNVISLLKVTGCYNVGDLAYFEPTPVNKHKDELFYPTDKAELKSALSSEHPGFGMLYAVRNKLNELLYGWYNAKESESLTYNCAAALALLGDSFGVPTLLDYASRHDATFPETSHKYNVSRGLAAVYLLGRLGTAEAADMLCGYLENPETLMNDKLEFGEFFSSMDDYLFQYRSFCTRALVEISNANVNLKPKILEVFEKTVLNDSFSDFVTLKATSTRRFDMSERFGNYIRNNLK